MEVLNIFIYFYKFIIYFWLRWVFVAARRLFSSCSEWGLLFIAAHGLLIAAASLVAELSAWASVVVARGLSICDSRALEHRLSSCGTRA